MKFIKPIFLDLVSPSLEDTIKMFAEDNIVSLIIILTVMLLFAAVVTIIIVSRKKKRDKNKNVYVEEERQTWEK